MQRIEFSINLQLLDGLIQKWLVLYCWQTYLCARNAGLFGFQGLCRQRQREFSSFIGLKCRVSMCVLIVHPSTGMWAGLYKKWSNWFVTVVCTFFWCDYNANSYQTRWSSNKITVLSTPFHFAAPYHQSSFVHPCRRKRLQHRTWTRAFPLGLLEDAGSHGARTPQLTESYWWDLKAVCLNTWSTICCAVFSFTLLVVHRKGRKRISHQSSSNEPYKSLLQLL